MPNFKALQSFILPLVAFAAISGYVYVKGLQVKALQKEIETSALVIATQDNAITHAHTLLLDWRANQIKTEQAMEAFNAVSSAARAQKDQTDRLFASHNLALLVEGRPTLMEKKINAASEAVANRLECLSRETGCSG